MPAAIRKRRLQETGGQEGGGLGGPRVCTANIGWTILSQDDIDGGRKTNHFVFR